MAQADLQLQLLNAASRMVADGGVLIYCVCSLSLEEGDEVIEKFLAESGNSFSRVGIAASELFDQTQLITPSGDLRTLPSHWPELGGLDGFFACRLIKRSSNSASSN
jgi:16S rRNA (cytosine967-C5)-methyltransferase